MGRHAWTKLLRMSDSTVWSDSSFQRTLNVINQEKHMASERYIRWQGYTISQLTFALNLFFGLSVGSLAFAFTLVKDKEFLLSGCPKYYFRSH